ncbi:MAG: ABC transporter ATP-binding protein [Nitrospirales bacterium]
MDEVIVVTNLGKRFRQYHPDRPRSLRDFFIRGPRWAKPVEYFWALRKVNFRVLAGSTLGVIGRNGAGKSTLLQIIGGVSLPDEGRVQVHQRIRALLELGSGLPPDLTGRESVILSGVINGLTRHEVSQRFEKILSFSELEQFIDSPIRTYSTGMKMRLAFAVAVHTDPELLLIDEVLSVGDFGFQQKCFEKIAQLKKEGCTMVLISHETSKILELCDEAIWLQKGEIAAHGNPEMVVEQYIGAEWKETRRRTPETGPTISTPTGAALRLHDNRFGSLELQIAGVCFHNSKGLQIKEIASGDPLTLEIKFQSSQLIDSANVILTIRREDGLYCFDTYTLIDEAAMPKLGELGLIILTFERLDLVEGTYTFDVSLYHRNWDYAYDSHLHVYSLLVHNDTRSKGPFCPPHRWHIGKLGEQLESPSIN